MKRSQFKRKMDRLAGRYFFLFCVAILRIMPEGLVYHFSRAIGRFGFFAARKHRRLTINNLTKAFKNEKSPQEIKKTALECFCQISWGAAETARLALDKKVHQKLINNVRIEGAEHLDQALSKKKGAICVSAHFGNFAIMTTRLALEGYPFTLVMRFADDPVVTELWQEVMKNIGIKVISARPRRKAVVESLRWLRDGKPLCLHSDQNKTDGVYVNFFGRPAGTVEGPARLHLRTGAPLLCAFIIRTSRTKHKIVITPQLDIKLTGDEQKDVHNITKAFTAEIEKIVRRYPEQWWWVHHRWKGAERLKQKSSDAATAAKKK
ncbi:MAG: lysophospholipid acyltransferase family protein [Candidatus Omnitrophica bacterium]|nr:lysophospholipid acyltransferase family protein [Candidatus Omnitrophota bacterium]